MDPVRVGGGGLVSPVEHWQSSPWLEMSESSSCYESGNWNFSLFSSCKELCPCSTRLSMTPQTLAKFLGRLKNTPSLPLWIKLLLPPHALKGAEDLYSDWGVMIPQSHWFTVLEIITP